jgi:FtsP/CotA-like multicopper oxidase with cupredoxin domain
MPRFSDAFLGSSVEAQFHQQIFPSNLLPHRSSVFINGSYPGPTIYASKGDWVRIDVENMLLSRLISIHWHGLTMVGQEKDPA